MNICWKCRVCVFGGWPTQSRKKQNVPEHLVLSCYLLLLFPLRPSATPCCICTAGARPFRSARIFVWIGGVPLHSSSCSGFWPVAPHLIVCSFRFLSHVHLYKTVMVLVLFLSLPSIPGYQSSGALSHPVSRPYAIRQTHAPESTSRSALPCCSALKRGILFSFAFQSAPTPHPQLQNQPDPRIRPR